MFKEVDKAGEWFALLWLKVSKMCEVKLTDGNVVRVKLKHLFEDHDYSKKLNAT
jgi:hypothetical protein